jgi:heptosyltransferase-3
VHFCTKILKNINKILIIIQRSNGDVFLSLTLINALYEYYDSPKIDLLVNDDTIAVANLLPHINHIHQFSYTKKKNNRWKQEKNLIKNIFRKYDLSINLTASDRSVFYALLASKKSISAIEKDNLKSWWKKLCLSFHYYFDPACHILINNSQPLNCLDIEHKNIQPPLIISDNVILNLRKRLQEKGIDDYIIFHPSAQYNYKIYPKHLRDELLERLNSLGIPILITGSNNKIDMQIKNEIRTASNIYNFIGKTTLEEYFALSNLSQAYIGMDTLNMHIAASQDKRIFAIFGSTKLSTWSPWSNYLQISAKKDAPIQTYDNVTIFQSSMPCKLCGVVGCGINHDKDEFPYIINSEDIFKEVEDWYKNSKK